MADKLILHVSQYNTHRILYTHALEDADYSVVTANNGKSAAIELSRMSPGGIDLVIMGSRLLDGVDELESAIVSMGKKAPPVIVHTAHPKVNETYEGTPLEPYIKDYVLKTSDTRLLVEAVIRVIGNP